MTRRYKTIMIDPPWPEPGGGHYKRGADRHYPLLKIHQIAPVILESGVFRPAPDCHLYLWVTNNHLHNAIALLPGLGFAYKTMITWAKPSMGIGQYFRGQTEHMIFAVRGNGLTLRREHTARRDLPTLITALRPVEKDGTRIHSAKPDQAYKLVEEASPGPRLEMFARRRRRGWSAWGNQLPKR